MYASKLRVCIYMILVWGELCTAESAFEVSSQTVKAGDMEKFIYNDIKIWDSFLKEQEGFMRKVSSLPFYDTLKNATTITQMIEWETFEAWHSVDKVGSRRRAVLMEAAMGYSTIYRSLPDMNGVRLIGSTTDDLGHILRLSVEEENGTAIEVLHQVVQEGDMGLFLELDDKYWTHFLQRQDGFLSKSTFFPFYDTTHNATDCFQVITWASEDQWKAVSDQAVAAVDSAMQRELGYSAFAEAYPSDFGSRIIRTS